MTKAQAESIKKVINQDKHHKTNFQSAKGELRIRVYSYNSDFSDCDVELEKERIKEVVDKIDTLPYRIEHKIYQGFIHDTCVVLY